MGRRRRGNDLEDLIGPIAVLVFIFGAVVVACLKVLLSILLIGGAAGLVCFGLYLLGRYVWARSQDVSRYIPDIDWSLPPVPGLDSVRVDIGYPVFSAKKEFAATNVVGTSGAWKDVLVLLDRFPCLRGAMDPEDLRARVAACDAAAADIFKRTSEAAERLVRQNEEFLRQQLREFSGNEKILEARVRRQLDRLRLAAEALCDGHFFDRLKAKRLNAQLSEFESRLDCLCVETRGRVQRHEATVRGLLDRDTRGRTLQEKINRELETMKGIIASKEFAGAVAEVAVINELRSLPAGCLVFNDVRLEAGRYIHFGGNPIMSAQIDTLVITAARVFVVEVKNWSSEFAQSGEGFNPFEQVKRASYLVYDQLRSAGFDVRTRSIIATNGSLPGKGDKKVTVVPVRRIRQYIENDKAAGVDVYGVRAALGL